MEQNLQRILIIYKYAEDIKRMVEIRDSLHADLKGIKKYNIEAGKLFES